MLSYIIHNFPDGYSVSLDGVSFDSRDLHSYDYAFVRNVIPYIKSIPYQNGRLQHMINIVAPIVRQANHSGGLKRMGSKKYSQLSDFLVLMLDFFLQFKKLPSTRKTYNLYKFNKLPKYSRRQYMRSPY